MPIVFGVIAAIITFFFLRRKGGIVRNILVFVITFVATGAAFLGVADIVYPHASSEFQRNYSLVMFPAIAVGAIVGMVAAKLRRPKIQAPQQ